MNGLTAPSAEHQVKAFLAALSRRGPDELLTASDREKLQLLADSDLGRVSELIAGTDPIRSFDLLLALSSALTELAKFDQVEEALFAWPEKSLPVAREIARNRLRKGDFAGTIRILEDHLDSKSNDDDELLLLKVAALYELDRLDAAESILAEVTARPSRPDLADFDLFDYAVARRRGEKRAIRRLDNLYERRGLRSVEVGHDSTGTFDDLVAEVIRSEVDRSHAPLVTVIMTAYNAAAYIDTSIRSILSQSLQDLELIVVSDAASDSTGEIVANWAKIDKRVKLLTLHRNSGTYVCKNTALGQARGEFIAFQDSDDWSHPDRLLCSVEALQQNLSAVAVRTHWVRMEDSGALITLVDGRIAHEACISLVFRRRPVLEKIGFFDCVRIEADAEYIRRLQIAFGASALVTIETPLLFGRMRADSLTYAPILGLGSEDRAHYRAAQAEWHRQLKHGSNPYVQFPSRSRPFEARPSLLP